MEIKSTSQSKWLIYHKFLSSVYSFTCFSLYLYSSNDLCYWSQGKTIKPCASMCVFMSQRHLNSLFWPWGLWRWVGYVEIYSCLSNCILLPITFRPSIVCYKELLNSQGSLKHVKFILSKQFCLLSHWNQQFSDIACMKETKNYEFVCYITFYLISSGDHFRKSWWHWQLCNLEAVGSISTMNNSGLTGLFLAAIRVFNLSSSSSNYQRTIGQWYSLAN